MVFQRIVKRLLEVLVVLLFAAIIFFTAAQVVTRYFTTNPFPWTEEMSRLLLVWASYLGVSIVLANRDHIRIDYFVNKLPERFLRYDRLFRDTLFLLFSFGVMYFGWLVSRAAWTDVSTALRYPRALFYLPIPISGAFNLFFVVPDLISDLRQTGELRTPKR
jgi:TRAP-type C4-dicarboxylate transport system permease small subunit